MSNCHRVAAEFRTGPDAIQRDSINCGGVDRPHVCGATVLVVDDDEGMLDTLGAALRWHSIDVVTARTGSEGIAVAASQRFDLLIVDLAMPDIRGIDVVVALQAQGIRVPFMVLSGFLTVPVVVEAMRLGAADVIDKLSVDIDEIVASVGSLLLLHSARDGKRARVEPAEAVTGDIACCGDRESPGSMAERWADYVVRACESPRDLRTISEWATWVGASAPSLREYCRLIGLKPRAARDLMRVLRALRRSAPRQGSVRMQLLVGDGRTLRDLMNRAGLSESSGVSSSTADEFLDRQRFVPADHEAIKALRRRLRS